MLGQEMTHNSDSSREKTSHGTGHPEKSGLHRTGNRVGEATGTAKSRC
jgi:hypothetical protein